MIYIQKSPLPFLGEQADRIDLMMLRIIVNTDRLTGIDRYYQSNKRSIKKN